MMVAQKKSAVGGVVYKASVIGVKLSPHVRSRMEQVVSSAERGARDAPAECLFAVGGSGMRGREPPAS